MARKGRNLRNFILLPLILDKNEGIHYIYKEKVMEMNMLIDRNELQLLLEKRRSEIGWGGLSGVDSLFAGATFLITTLPTKYESVWNIPGGAVKAFLILLGAAYTVFGLVVLFLRFFHNYDHEKLFREIEGMDKVKYAYTIVAIKDTFHAHANRFLLYYDTQWDCRFFPSYKTAEENESSIRERLSHELKLDPESIVLEPITEVTQKKFAPHAKVERVYSHTLYLASIQDFPENLKQDEFEIDGKKYCWMSIPQMEQDHKIQERNMEVVGLVKSNVA